MTTRKKKKQKKSSTNTGDNISCRWKAGNYKFYPATIINANLDGSYHVKFDDGDVDFNVKDCTTKDKGGKKYKRMKLISPAVKPENYHDLNANDLESLFNAVINIPKRSLNKDESINLDAKQVKQAIDLGILISVRSQSEIEEDQDVVWCRGSDADYRNEDNLPKQKATGSYLATKISEKDIEFSDGKDSCHVPECNYIIVNHAGFEPSEIIKNGCVYRYADIPPFPRVPKRSLSNDESKEIENSVAELAIQCGLLELIVSQDQLSKNDDVVWRRGSNKDHRRSADKGEKDTYVATKIEVANTEGWNANDTVTLPEQKYVMVSQNKASRTAAQGTIYRYTSKGSLTKLLGGHLKENNYHIGSLELNLENEILIFQFCGMRQGYSNQFAVPYYARSETSMLLYQSPSTGKLCLAYGINNMMEDKPIMSTKSMKNFGSLIGETSWLKTTKKKKKFDASDGKNAAACAAAAKYEAIICRIYQEYDTSKGTTFQNSLRVKFKGIEETLITTLFEKFKCSTSDIRRLTNGEIRIVSRCLPEPDPVKVQIKLISSGFETRLPLNDPLVGTYKIHDKDTSYSGSSKKFYKVKDTSTANPNTNNYKNTIKWNSSKWYVYDESGNRSDNPRWKATKEAAIAGYLAMVPDGIEIDPVIRDKIDANYLRYPPMFGWSDCNHEDVVTAQPPFFLHYSLPDEEKKQAKKDDGSTDVKISTQSSPSSAQDIFGDEEEEEIQQLFSNQKKKIELRNAKPILNSLRTTISHLIGIVGKINVTTGSSLYYNLRCMVTKLTPYNLNVNGNSNNEWLVTNTKINALLYPWKASIPILVRAFRRSSVQIITAQQSLNLLREFHVPALLSLNADLLQSVDVRSIRRMCLSGIATNDDLRIESKRLMARRIPELRTKLLEEGKASRQKRAEEIATSRDIKRLAYDLQLDEDATEDMGKLLAREEAWVGATNVKIFVKGYLDDVIGRLRLREKPIVRHIMLQGNSGTGKATAADFISKWITLIHKRSLANKENGTASMAIGGKTPTWCKVGSEVQLINISGDGAQGQLKLGDCGKITEVKATKCKVRGWYYLFADLGRPERSTAFVEVGSFKELEKELEELPLNEIETYYLRLGGRAGGNVNQILSTAAYKHCVVIFGGSAQACQSFASSSTYFLRQDPIVIDMPVLSTEELAKISLQRIEDRGYKLSCPGSSRSNTSTSQLKAMIGIVAQKYSNSDIVKRNAYLANDCVELAVSRKNRRLRDFEQAQRLSQDSIGANDVNDSSTNTNETLSKSEPLPFLLEALDFDVKTISLEERKRKQTLINLKILAMKGWGSETEIGSPLHWFATQRRILEKIKTRTDETKEVEMSPWDFNLVVESGNGGGKSTFVQYVSEFLEAYGILESSKLIKRSATELRAGKWDSDDDAKLKATGAFADARESNGGLLVVHAETLAPSAMLVNSGPGGGSPISQLGTVLANQVGTLPFVALACEDQMARAVLSSHPDLSSKFPSMVRIVPPTSPLLTEIAQEYSEKTRGVQFANGLKEVLIEHIQETNDGTTGMRYAKTLVDDALRRRAERRSTAVKKINKVHGETKQDSAADDIDNPCLIPVDFEIGKELGDAEAREEIYRDLEGLIGMKKAKEWLRKIRRQIDLANKTKDRRGLKRC